MAKPSNRKRGRKAPSVLLEKGLMAIAMGIGLLILSAFLGSKQPMMAAVATAVSMPAWWAIGIGAVMLALHGAKRLAEKAGPPPPPVNMPRSKTGKPPPPPAAIRALIDKAERDSLHLTKDTPDPAPSFGHERFEAWGPDVFAAIEWRRFEAVCEALFAQAGFDTRSQSHGADGGVDIWLYSKNAQGPASVVQCKHWQSKPVGVNEMRAFLGVMASHQLKRGTYATTSTYTADAQAFATANGINALSGVGLLALIRQRTPAQQTALLAKAFEGEYWKPTCASCGIKMVEREARTSGDPFWGCANYPRCRRTLKSSTPTATA